MKDKINIDSGKNNTPLISGETCSVNDKNIESQQSYFVKKMNDLDEKHKDANINNPIKEESLIKKNGSIEKNNNVYLNNKHVFKDHNNGTSHNKHVFEYNNLDKIYENKKIEDNFSEKILTQSKSSILEKSISEEIALDSQKKSGVATLLQASHFEDKDNFCDPINTSNAEKQLSEDQIDKFLQRAKIKFKLLSSGEKELNVSLDDIIPGSSLLIKKNETGYHIVVNTDDEKTKMELNSKKNYLLDRLKLIDHGRAQFVIEVNYIPKE